MNGSVLSPAWPACTVTWISLGTRWEVSTWVEQNKLWLTFIFSIQALWTRSDCVHVAKMQIFVKSVIYFFFNLQMESHCATDCPKAPIACNFSLFGCKEKVSTSMEAVLWCEFFGTTTTWTAFTDAAPRPRSAHAGFHADAHALHGRFSPQPQPQWSNAQTPKHSRTFGFLWGSWSYVIGIIL